MLAFYTKHDETWWELIGIIKQCSNLYSIGQNVIGKNIFEEERSPLNNEKYLYIPFE